MHQALMCLQYKHSPPNVELSEQVQQAMQFTEQQCPQRGGGRGLGDEWSLWLPSQDN